MYGSCRDLSENGILKTIRITFSECSKVEGMENPAIITPGRINSNLNGTDNPENARPGEKGWTPKVPSTGEEKKPTLVVDLTNTDGGPTEFEKVKINGNVKTITIIVTLEDGTNITLVSMAWHDTIIKNNTMI